MFAPIGAGGGDGVATGTAAWGLLGCHICPACGKGTCAIGDNDTRFCCPSAVSEENKGADCCEDNGTVDFSLAPFTVWQRGHRMLVFVGESGISHCAHFISTILIVVSLSFLHITGCLTALLLKARRTFSSIHTTVKG